MYKRYTDRISRRSFMGRTLATGATLAGASGLASAAFAQVTPKKGGTLKIGSRHGSTTDTIDPAHLENGFQVIVTRSFANNLTEIGSDGMLKPSLAESWEASPDATEWTFRLRQGVEFHNGKTLSAEDVIASINHHRGEESTSSVKPLAEAIDDIVKIDDLTVKFVLSGGNADFPFSMDTPGFMIVPAEPDGSIDWSKGIGTGGYKLENFKPGVSATLVRNENFWNPDRAHVDRVEVFTLADPSARSSALLTGDVDVVDHVELKTATLLGRKPGITIDETSGPLHYTFAMLTKTAPFDDVNVRRALKHGIDRNEVLEKILFGHGTIGNDNPIGPSYRYHAADLEQNSYDPDKARFYLKEAGLSDLTVDLSAADAAFTGAVDAAVLYKAGAEKAGITINVVREVNDGYWADVWLKKPFCAVYWGGYAAEDTMLSTGYHPSSSWNDTQWDDEKFNKLLLEARAELDEDLRREMYREMQMILRDDGGMIVPCFANNVMARNDNVQHSGVLSPQGTLDGSRLAERWWLA